MHAYFSPNDWGFSEARNLYFEQTGKTLLHMLCILQNEKAQLQELQLCFNCISRVIKRANQKNAKELIIQFLFSRRKI